MDLNGHALSIWHTRTLQCVSGRPTSWRSFPERITACRTDTRSRHRRTAGRRVSLHHLIIRVSGAWHSMAQQALTFSPTDPALQTSRPGPPEAGLGRRIRHYQESWGSGGGGEKWDGGWGRRKKKSMGVKVGNRKHLGISSSHVGEQGSAGIAPWGKTRRFSRESR